MAFDSLSFVLNGIPYTGDVYYGGDEHVYREYPEILKKLIKYSIDEKDLDLKIRLL
jgi:hypothetical protein